MILIRSRLVLGIIFGTVKAVLKAIYKLIELVNLQYALLAALVGIVLYFSGAFDENAAFKTVYDVLFIVTVIYAVVATIKRLLGIEKKVKRSKGAQIVKTNGEEQAEQPKSHEPPKEVVEEISVQPEKPVYFRVKQNPEYVMAEYSDRYELFKTSNGKLTKIRTDYK